MRALIIVLCLLATPVLADVTGPARVIDGDTLEVAGCGYGFTGSTRRRRGKLAGMIGASSLVASM